MEYAWRPAPCKACRAFNHSEGSRPLKQNQKQLWVLKQKPSAEHSSSKLVVDSRCPAETVPRDTDTNENEGFMQIDREYSKSPIHQIVLLLTRRINQLQQV